MKNSAKVMTTDVVTVAMRAPLAEAMNLMRSNGIRHLPVKDQDEIVGILSDRDLQGTDGDDSLMVLDCMSAPVRYIPPTTSVAEAAGIMRREKLSSLLVGNAQKIEGILTADDLLRVLEFMADDDAPGMLEQATARVNNWTHSMPVAEVIGALSSSGI
ncbi:MAG: CBS domain-containing protein [Bdellovibrionales bacterium]|nr:CBS domain-containing protein [Bdellovibrionales bacterium]